MRQALWNEIDKGKPTFINIFSFTGCIQQEVNYGVAKNTIINSPITITNINQITNIVNNVNALNSNVNTAIAVANNVDNNVVNNLPPKRTTAISPVKPHIVTKPPVVPPKKIYPPDPILLKRF